MCAYTPCFRREAGSYGKDVRGLNRLHPFDRVEIVQIQHPEKSYDTVEEVTEYVASLLRAVGLQVRILSLCGGDRSFASDLTYDFEVFSAAFFFQAEDGIRDLYVTGVQTCALPI